LPAIDLVYTRENVLELEREQTTHDPAARFGEEIALDMRDSLEREAIHPEITQGRINPESGARQRSRNQPPVLGFAP
jgi:hypothetical protein